MPATTAVVQPVTTAFRPVTTAVPYYPAASVASPRPTMPSLQQPMAQLVGGRKHIVCFGDSNTAGFPPGKIPYGRTLEKSLRDAGYDVEVTICGHSGLTAKELLEKANWPAIPDVTGTPHPGLAVVLSQKPVHLVLIMLGTNGLPGQSEEEVLQYVETLHQMCHQRGAKTVAFAAVTVDAQRAPPGLRAKRDRLAHDLHVFDTQDPNVIGFADPRDLVPRRPGYWDADGLHFTNLGYATFAHGVVPVVMEALNRMAHEGYRF